MDKSTMVPAAQYLRMSTEHQKYSLENQAAAIASYAESHGFSVIKTYADSGKSGLYLKHRAALSLLLKDVINREVSYKAILVYDVSRWGRFQDADEAAHYEFICTSAGIRIHYCAETFHNDGSLSAIVMKALKRAMAREYSRELSVKTASGKKRIATMGFRAGGTAGFGLRRMLIAADGSRRRVLQRGDYKAVATDRVILVPGPPEEIACVHDIFRMCLEGKGFAAIARKLNHEHVDCPKGKWKPHLIRDILTNPKYIGWLVWGRVEVRLTGPPRHLPIDQWIIKPDVFQPIVDKSTFIAAQHLLHRAPSKSHEA